MRDTDLWQDLADALVRMFGAKCGTICGVAMEIAAGETDLLAARVDTSVDTDNKAQSYKVQKRKLIASRLIASQAVASEFIIAGAFLAVTLAQFVLDMADANVHRRTILPTPPGGIATGCDPCVCDLNGKVVGQWSTEVGGCAAREFSYEPVHDDSLDVDLADVGHIIPDLCRVPAQCVDDAVTNATNIIRNITGTVD